MAALQVFYLNSFANTSLLGTKQSYKLHLCEIASFLAMTHQI